MNYKNYTLEILDNLGAHRLFRGCEYIVCSIDYLRSLNHFVAPDSEMIYNHAAGIYFLTPMSIENSIRNVIQLIWTNKENPDLMIEIFGNYNMDKRPSNLEFLMMLYGYMRLHLEDSDTLRKLDVIWEDSKKTYAKNKSD